MKKLLLAAVAAVLLAPVAPAKANPDHGFIGGCIVATVSDGGDDDQTTWHGQASVVVVTANGSGIPTLTGFINVKCHVYKNGVYQGTVLHAWGTGVAADAAVYTYQAAPSDLIEICTEYVGSSYRPPCNLMTADPLVPDEVHWAVDTVLYPVDEVLRWADATTCPVLAVGWWASVPGGLDITPEGDVYVGGEFVYDCPPYDGERDDIASPVLATNLGSIVGP